MKSEEGRGQEEIVHGVEVNTAQSRDDEHQEKEEEQGDRSEVTDFTSQWAGLELLRHSHADLKSRDQIVVVPCEVPAIGGQLFRGGRKRVLCEINVVEVSVHVQREITHLGNAVGQLVTPALQTLRTIADMKRRNLVGFENGLSVCALIVAG